MFRKTTLSRGRNRRGGRSGWARLGRAVRSGPAAFDPLQPDDRPDEDFEVTWRRVVKWRTFVALAFVGLWATGLEARLVYLQVVRHDFYLAQAIRQQRSVIRPEALRGDIVDRHGRLLAYSADADSIVADPALVDDPGETARAVCDALGDCSASERRDLASQLATDKRFTRIRRSRDVSPEQVSRVEALDLPGIVLRSQPLRYYPRLETAAHVVGFVGEDNQGRAGVEYSVRQGRAGRGRPGVRAGRRTPASAGHPRRARARARREARTHARSLPAVRHRTRAPRGRRSQPCRGRHGHRDGPVDRRDPRHGQLSDVQSEHLRSIDARRTPEPRDPGRLRARVDVQDRHRVGRARGPRGRTERSDRHPARLHHHSRPPEARLRHARERRASRSRTSSSSRATWARSRWDCGPGPGC